MGDGVIGHRAGSQFVIVLASRLVVITLEVELPARLDTDTQVLDETREHGRAQPAGMLRLAQARSLADVENTDTGKSIKSFPAKKRHAGQQLLAARLHVDRTGGEVVMSESPLSTSLRCATKWCASLLLLGGACGERTSTDPALGRALRIAEHPRRERALPPPAKFVQPVAWTSWREGVEPVARPDLAKETWRVFTNREQPIQRETPTAASSS